MLTEDDILEILSMMDPLTIERLTFRCTSAQLVATADMATCTTEGGKKVLERHVTLANKMLELIQKHSNELKALQEQVA